MAEQKPDGQIFTIQITALIAEIESCMNAERPGADRETRLQREAFRERCRQARSLAERLAAASDHEWSLNSGDAHRIRQSLQHSLNYFRAHKPD